MKKKTRTSESGAHTSSSNLDTSLDVDNYEVRTRPIGRKATKRKGKAKFTILEEMKEIMEKVLRKIYRVHSPKIG